MIGEIIVIELPPGPAPERPTVHMRSHSLSEHLAGFMSINNSHGYLPNDPPIEDNLVFKLLYKEFDVEYSTLDHVKRIAKRIKKLSAGQTKHSSCLHMIAAIYGYPSYEALHQSARIRGKFEIIRNLRYVPG